MFFRNRLRLIENGWQVLTQLLTSHDRNLKGLKVEGFTSSLKKRNGETIGETIGETLKHGEITKNSIKASCAEDSFSKVSGAMVYPFRSACPTAVSTWVFIHCRSGSSSDQYATSNNLEGWWSLQNVNLNYQYATFIIVQQPCQYASLSSLSIKLLEISGGWFSIR